MPMPNDQRLRLTSGSISEVLSSYKGKPFDCLCEYIWNSFDANAKCVELNFDVPAERIGHADNVTLADDGDGWNFDDEIITNNFMVSLKQPSSDHSLPHGKSGKGRYAFIWICDHVDIYSGGKMMTLNKSVNIAKNEVGTCVEGTKVCFRGIKEEFSECLLEDGFKDALLGEFGWLLLQDKKIIINGELLKVEPWIDSSSCNLVQNDFPEEIRTDLGRDFEARIVVWKKKPREYSRFYFLDAQRNELFKKTTGFNKKRDDFWHSVYIKSEIFAYQEDIDDAAENGQLTLQFGGVKQARLKRAILKLIRTRLSEIRKPQLVRTAEAFYGDLEAKRLLPNLPQFGIYDEQSFKELIKEVYVLAPSLFNNRSEDQKQFLCTSLAGLLSSQDDSLLKVIFEQLLELSEEEKTQFGELLSRTHLSNVVRLAVEVDKRLEVIDKLEHLLSEHRDATLEVKHIQRILNDNFWLFGEQFRLFSTTEGALHKVLTDYAKEILGIDMGSLVNKPMGELDLFLTKTQAQGETIQRNVIVELKRASIKLRKKQYDQLEKYMEDVLREPLCNGTNQYWEFYLIGTDYDDHIENKIESAKTWGEKDKGLCTFLKDGHVKMYVRKWSDILGVEWKAKMNYLSQKLNTKPRPVTDSPDAIVADLVAHAEVTDNCSQ